MNRKSRMLISALFGILTPVGLLVLAAFLRAFRLPDSLVTGVLWILLWPVISPVYRTWCRFLTSPPSAVQSLIIGSVVDSLIVFALVYLLLGLLKSRVQRLPVIPAPPTF
jgi:hypothetical protein